MNGVKTWEMRSTNTSRRGPVALIEKGSGHVVGVAELVEVKGPFTAKEMAAHEPKHQIPSEIYQAPDYKWHHAWVLQNATALPSPIPYKHKNGAVIWVLLDEKAQQDLAAQISQMGWPPRNEAQTSGDAHGRQLVENAVTPTAINQRKLEYSSMVPVAKDGSAFDKEFCKRGGQYTVGGKGEERQFRDYEVALGYLRQMPVAKWRRPNAEGNWGIVSAVEWVDVPADGRGLEAASKGGRE